MRYSNFLLVGCLLSFQVVVLHAFESKEPKVKGEVTSEQAAPSPPASNKNAASPNKHTTGIHFLTDPGRVFVNVDQKVLLSELKKVVESTNEFAGSLGERNGVGRLTLTYEKGKPTTVAVQTVPQISEKELEQFKSKLRPLLKLQANIYQMPVAIDFQMGEGVSEEQQFGKPEPLSELRYQALREMNIEDATEVIRNFAKHEALPVIAAFMVQADAKLKGVPALGKLINELDWSKRIDVGQVIDSNSVYWIAMMEMEAQNPLVTSARIFLHAANGNMDHAERYMGVQSIWMEEKSVAGGLLVELEKMMGSHYTKLEKEINRGKALHDQGKFDDACAGYQKLLKSYPNSAEAQYEYWFSGNMKTMLAGAKKGGNKEDDKKGIATDADYDSWVKASKIIYGVDPLYPMDARSKDELSNFLLVRRFELKALLAKPMDVNGLVQYADIAVDLKVYPFAAELYWLLVSNQKPAAYGNRNLLHRMVYCVSLAGTPELVKFFKKMDFEAEKREVEADFEKRMKGGSEKP